MGTAVLRHWPPVGLREAHGDLLEIAIGIGRNLPDYPREVRLTGIT